MLYADGLGLVVVMGLWVFCLVDAVVADEAQVRNLPKVLWVLLVLLTFEIGAILWLVAGRPRTRQAPHRRSSGIPPEYDRPGRAAALNPDDDAAFLEGLRQRAEEQRRKAAEEARRLREQEGDQA